MIFLKIIYETEDENEYFYSLENEFFKYYLITVGFKDF